jgi:hypothetical protein
VLVAEWLDDMEGDTSGWDDGKYWNLVSNEDASNSPTHFWQFERSPGTTTGHELVSPAIDLRFYNTSCKLPPNIRQSGLQSSIWFNYFFTGRLYGTGQDSIELLFKASNMTEWLTLAKYDGNTQVGTGIAPGDFTSEWYKYKFGIYMGDYAGQIVQFKWRFVKGSQFSGSWWAVDDTIVFMQHEKNVPPWFLQKTPDSDVFEMDVGAQATFKVFAEDPTFDEPIIYKWFENWVERPDWTGNETLLRVPRTSSEDKYKRGNTLLITLGVFDGLDWNYTSWTVHLKDPRPLCIGCGWGHVEINEDEPKEINFGTASDPTWFIDPEGQEFTVTCTGSQHIDATDQGNNVFAFVNKVPNWNGFDNVTVTVTDSAGTTANFTHTFWVVPVNDPPRWKPVMLPNGEQDSYYSFNLTATDIDDRVEDLTYSDDSDLFAISATGEIAFVPRNAQVGYNFFNVTVTDPDGLVDVMELRLLVANVNDPPRIRYIKPQFAKEDEVFTLDVSQYVEDPDLLLPPEFRDRITYRDDTTKLETNIETGVVTWNRPTYEDVGEFYFRITIQDSKGRYAEQEVKIIVEGADRPIKYGIIPPQVLYQGVTYTFEVPVLNQEQPSGEVVELLHSNDHRELFVIGQTTGLIYFTPRNEHVGEWKVTLTLMGLDGEIFDVRSVSFTVMNQNDRPDLEQPGPLQAFEEVPFELQLRANDPDMMARLTDGLPVDPGERLSFGTTSEVVTVDPDTGLLYLFPTRDDARRGEVQVRVIVRDMEGEEDTMVIVIPVGYVVPPLPPLPKVRWPANGTLVEEGQEVDFRLVFPDGSIPVGGSLTVTVTSDQQGVLSQGTTDGEYAFTVSKLTPGKHRITITVSDGERENSTWMELKVDGDMASLNGSFIVIVVTMLAMMGAVIYLFMMRGRR